MKKNSGITLVALVITIIVLVILVSITSYTADNLLDNSRFEVFTTEMKIMQQEVNTLYQKNKSGDGTIKIDDITYNIEELGQEYSQAENFENAFLGAFGEHSTIDRNKFRYYDNATIEKLELKGITQEFLVSIDLRTVVSLNGIEYEGQTYYTLDQVENETHNVEYRYEDE